MNKKRMAGKAGERNGKRKELEQQGRWEKIMAKEKDESTS